MSEGETQFRSVAISGGLLDLAVTVLDDRTQEMLLTMNHRADTTKGNCVVSSISASLNPDELGKLIDFLIDVSEQASAAKLRLALNQVKHIKEVPLLEDDAVIRSRNIKGYRSKEK